MNSYSTIIEEIDTKYQSQEFVQQLEKVTESLYGKNNLDEVLNMYFSESVKSAFLSALKQDGVALDKRSLNQYIEGLVGFIKTVPSVTLVLAYNPTGKKVKELVRWFEINLQKKVFVDIVTDQTIMGGAVIKYKGLYKNYSLAKDL